MSNLLKPGTDNASSGKYVEVGSRGGKVANARVVTIGTGDRLPPTQKPDRNWVKKK